MDFIEQTIKKEIINLLALISETYNLNLEELINLKSSESNLLSLVNIPSDINIKRLKNLISELINVDLIYFQQEKSNLTMDKISIERRIADSCNGKRVGQGNKPFDIITPSGQYIDVCGVCLKGATTNEKSLIQNFRTAGTVLDNYFLENKHNEALELFKNTLKNKCQVEIYHLFVISTTDKIYIVCLKLNTDNIDNIKSNGFTKKKSSIVLDNVIDKKLGKAKLYKSKKRIELRLNKEILNSAILIYETKTEKSV